MSNVRINLKILGSLNKALPLYLFSWLFLSLLNSRISVPSVPKWCLWSTYDCGTTYLTRNNNNNNNDNNNNNNKL